MFEDHIARVPKSLAAIVAEIESNSAPPNTLEECKRFIEQTRRDLGLPAEKDPRDLKDYISYDLLGGAMMELYHLVPVKDEDEKQVEGYLEKKLAAVLTALGLLWQKENRKMAKPTRPFKKEQIGIRSRIWVDIESRTFALHTWRIRFPHVVPKGMIVDYASVPPFEQKFDIEYDGKKQSSVAFVCARKVNTQTGEEIECIDA